MRRTVAVLCVVVLATLAARAAVPARAHRFHFSAALTCGVERWNVKTLKDRPRLLRAKPTTVAHLVRLPAPGSLPPTRLPFEYHVFSLVAAVTLNRLESDQDFHLVLQSGANHMIAESPARECTTGATSYRRKQMFNVRHAVRLCAKARVTGVAFFDFKHGQTGVAPNAIELHPILDFICQV